MTYIWDRTLLVENITRVWFNILYYKYYPKDF